MQINFIVFCLLQYDGRHNVTMSVNTYLIKAGPSTLPWKHSLEVVIFQDQTLTL
jgi:hypothetical protein